MSGSRASRPGVHRPDPGRGPGGGSPVGLVARVEHLWEQRRSPEARQLFRYAMVSVISTVVSFGVLALVFGVLRLWGEVVSTVVANVAATFPAYYLNRRWVWGKTGRSHLGKEIIPFWAMQSLGILVSVGGAALARHYGIEHHLSHRMQTGLVLVANLASFGLFYVLKYAVFNRLFRVHTLEELDEAVESLVAGGPRPVPELRVPGPVPDLFAGGGPTGPVPLTARAPVPAPAGPRVGGTPSVQRPAPPVPRPAPAPSALR